MKRVKFIFAFILMTNFFVSCTQDTVFEEETTSISQETSLDTQDFNKTGDDGDDGPDGDRNGG